MDLLKYDWLFNGKIISSKPTKILLDVNGVGYAVNISINTFENISDKEIRFVVYLYECKRRFNYIIWILY